MTTYGRDRLIHLSSEHRAEIEGRIAAFEEAWRRGGPPSIAEYLPTDSILRKAVLVELIRIDRELRIQAGKPRPVDAYLKEFPEIANELDQFRSPVLTETLIGETPTIAPRHSSESQPPASAQRIDRNGRYKVEKVVGSGGFATVYLAYDQDLQRHVAIKVPLLHRATTELDGEKFLDEARILAGLDHPNIVPVHDVGRTEDGGCYVVSKFIEGVDLRERLEQKRFSPDESAELVTRVAKALHYAHTKGLVHRDVKPGNILIDGQGKPYVADFGIALRDADFGKASDDALVGTPMYMSPEQAQGKGHLVDGRSDVFSLGVVLYEMLTGVNPFRGANWSVSVFKITTVEAKPPRQIVDTIPQELERICLKAMSKQLSDRYTTAKDLAEELGQFVQSRAHRNESALHSTSVSQRSSNVPASPTGQDLTARPLPWATKRMVILAGAALVVVALLAGVVVSLRTANGTLVVEISEPDAVVQVVDSAGKIEVTRHTPTQVISFEIEPGMHKLKVTKDGFAFLAREFAIAARQTEVIKATLVPLEPTGSAQQSHPQARQGEIRSTEVGPPDPQAQSDLDLVKWLTDAGKKPLARSLAHHIAAAKTTTLAYNIGHIIVGRVVIEGSGDPRDVNAQMEILDEGYFAGEVKSAGRPVGFYLHGFQPIDVIPKGKPGSVEYVGVVAMKRVPKEKQSALAGRLVLEGNPDVSHASLTMKIAIDHVNTPNNGIGLRSNPPEPLRIAVDKSGAFSADGFSPMRYFLSVNAPGHVAKVESLEFVTGDFIDVGEIRLEIPLRVRLSFLVSDQPKFASRVQAKRSLNAGEVWQADPTEEAAWDLGFAQQKGKLQFNYSYGPCEMADLGPGKIDDFRTVDPNRFQFRRPDLVPATSGHVYLLNQQHFRHWVLFRLD